MFEFRKTRTVWAACLSAVVSFSPGCESLPGTARSQGAVIGGVAGAAAGALIAKNNRLLGALIGVAAGAGGGYLIGATIENARGDEESKREAQSAARRATESPATVEQAKNASTGDLNQDGFVTLVEVVAMERAGLTDDEIVERLRLTGQVFELTDEQEEYLTARGVSRWVIEELETINQEAKNRLLEERTGSDVISQEPRP